MRHTILTMGKGRDTQFSSWVREGHTILTMGKGRDTAPASCNPLEETCSFWEFYNSKGKIFFGFCTFKKQVIEFAVLYVKHNFNPTIIFLFLA